MQTRDEAQKEIILMLKDILCYFANPILMGIQWENRPKICLLVMMAFKLRTNDVRSCHSARTNPRRSN